MGNLNAARPNHPARNAMNLEKAASGLSRGMNRTTGSLPRCYRLPGR
jgi:hypothetical protein